MSHQNPLTLVTPILPERLSDLYSYLAGLKYALEKGNHSLIEKSKTVHYLRWIVIDDKNSKFFKDTEREPKLVFSSNFDGSVDKHITDLCSHDEEKLIDRLYSCCVGYPKESERNLESRKAFLKKHMVKVSAFYKGSIRRSVEQIRLEQKLRLFIRDLLNKKNWSGTAKEVHKNLKAAVAKEPEFQWAKKPFRMPRNNWFKLILLGLVLLILSPIIIIWVLIVQYRYESKDEYYTKTRSDIDPAKIEILEEYEDLTDGEDSDNNDIKDKVINYQNQFSQLVDMKPGKVRLITFKAMMLFARVLIPIKFVKGELMGIPTIHFARWVLFDNNKRVLFFSNFDGSWQQYLGDFIDQSGWGLSAIFSNTMVFPKTNFLGLTGVAAMSKNFPRSGPLFPGGAYDEEHFLAWSRDSELPTQIWYSAYPHLSIKNVNNNSRIRSMLFKNLNERQAQDFFQLI